jgi:hypothetical protein
MANENTITLGTEKTLEANGGSCASAAIVQANDATYGIVADGASFPDAEFALRCQWATITSIENKTIDLYARELNFDSTNDAIAPTATFTHKYINSFRISAVAANTDQYMHLVAREVPREAEYYIINSSGQTISSGWTLKVTPRSNKPAA